MLVAFHEMPMGKDDQLGLGKGPKTSNPVSQLCNLM